MLKAHPKIKTIAMTGKNEIIGNETTKAQGKILLIGDSHVRRLQESNPLHESIILPKGIGGVKSNQVLSRHKPNINRDLESADEVIIHLSSNDISQLIKEQVFVQNIEPIGKHLVEMNH